MAIIALIPKRKASGFAGSVDVELLTGHTATISAPPVGLVSRNLFLTAVASYINSGTVSLRNSWSIVYGAANANAPVFRVSFKVPDDFVSFESMKAVWEATSSGGNMYWRFNASYAAPGEIVNIHSDSTSLGVTADGGAQILNVQESPDPLTLKFLAKGDYLGVLFTREGTHANDTIDNQVNVFGLLFTYRASQ